MGVGRLAVVVVVLHQCGEIERKSWVCRRGGGNTGVVLSTPDEAVDTSRLAIGEVGKWLRVVGGTIIGHVRRTG